MIWGQGKMVSKSGEFTPLYQGRSSHFVEGGNLTTRIEESVDSGDLKDVELFVFTDNLVFDHVFYKGTSKITLLFEFVLRLHQVQMLGELILHVIRIAGTCMTNAGIDGLSRGNNLGGMMRLLNPLQFSLLDQGEVLRLSS